MKISVKLTRAENTALLGAGPVELDLEEYLCGVVPSEIYESSHMEALKAQAVAARTFAVRRAMAGTVVDDTTSFQAYRAPLAESSPRSRQAVEETAGQVLTYSVFDEAGKVVYAGSAAASTYTVQKGDSLWAIAEKHLGNGTRYNEIKKLNGLTSDVIYAGQVLKLPNR